MPPKGKSDPPESTVDTPPAEPDTRTVDSNADRFAELEHENAELRRQLAEARAGGTVVRLETDATPLAEPRRLVISQGVWDDLVRHGKVQDPGSGYLLFRDDLTGDVTVVDRRTGEPAQGVELAERRG